MARTSSAGSSTPTAPTTATSLATLADGRVVAAFGQDEDISGWNGEQDIYTVIYDPRLAGVRLAGTGQADHFVGTGFDDTFVMGRGADTVLGPRLITSS